MPDAAAENNRAGENHPAPGGDGGGSGGEGAGQPDDVPPAHSNATASESAA